MSQNVESMDRPLTLKDFEIASHRLERILHSVPLSSSKTFSDMTGAQVYLKFENQQKTGSFKVRGASNKIISLHEQGGLKAVVASSAGNHAQGVAYAASRIGVPATICMPLTAPLTKVNATEGYGASVVLHGVFYDDAYSKAVEIKEETGATFIHPFDDLEVMAGQGTIAIEVLRDLPSVDMVVVPAGGGGLLSGIACCIKQINPRIQVVGVQAEGADAICRGFNHPDEPIDQKGKVHTIADGIAVKNPGTLTMGYIRQYVDRMVTVSDAEIAATILLLLERAKQVVEPAGAAALAAVLNKKLEVTGKKVVCLLSGGNIDVSFIHRIVEKGLTTRGRNIKFNAILTDSPGALEEFAKIIAGQRANIILFQHDRLSADLDLDQAIIHVVCEVGGFEHGAQLMNALQQHGYIVRVE